MLRGMLLGFGYTRGTIPDDFEVRRELSQAGNGKINAALHQEGKRKLGAAEARSFLLFLKKGNERKRGTAFFQKKKAAGLAAVLKRRTEF